jgi:uncharacterized protein (DUF1697 family)
LPSSLAALLEARHGLRVPVVLLTASELGEAARGHPLAAARVDPRALHVAFLSAQPSKESARSLDPTRSPPDAFALRGRILYLSLPNGVARTRFTSDYLDRTLGTICTLRNWRTVGELAALAGRT